MILLFVAEDIFEISASRPCSANSSLLLLRILLSYNEYQKSQNPLLSGGNFSPVPSVHNGRSFLVAIFRYPFFSTCYRGVSVAPMLRGLSKLQFSPTRCAVVGIAPNNSSRIQRLATNYTNFICPLYSNVTLSCRISDFISSQICRISVKFSAKSSFLQNA